MLVIFFILNSICWPIKIIHIVNIPIIDIYPSVRLLIIEYCIVIFSFLSNTKLGKGRSWCHVRFERYSFDCVLKEVTKLSHFLLVLREKKTLLQVEYSNMHVEAICEVSYKRRTKVQIFCDLMWSYDKNLILRKWYIQFKVPP
jgi:hypothetical protein